MKCGRAINAPGVWPDFWVCCHECWRVHPKNAPCLSATEGAWFPCYWKVLIAREGIVGKWVNVPYLELEGASPAALAVAQDEILKYRRYYESADWLTAIS